MNKEHKNTQTAKINRNVCSTEGDSARKKFQEFCAKLVSLVDEFKSIASYFLYVQYMQHTMEPELNGQQPTGKCFGTETHRRRIYMVKFRSLARTDIKWVYLNINAQFMYNKK